MHQVPNYRISLKKNISLKTLSYFNSAKKVTDKFQLISQKAQKQKSKPSFNNKIPSTQKSVIFSKKSQNKTFSFDSSDQYIKRILIANQWNLLPNQLSMVRLKWISLPKPCHYQSLQANHLINHFKHSYKLTTKLGLYNLLSSPHQQNLTDHKGNNYLKYFPRSYDLGAEYQAFCLDFEHTAVLNLMKKLMIHVEIMHEKTLYPKYKKICERFSFKNSQQKLLENIQCDLKFKDQLFEQQPQEQKILVNKVIFINLLKYWKYHLEGNSFQKITSSSLVHSLKSYSKLNPPFTNPDTHFNNQSQISFLSHSSAILFFKLYFYCLQTHPNFLNDGLTNIWIIKSNESSRGRNIFLIEDIKQAQLYRNGGNKLIQKYIQNVWILNKDHVDESIKNTKIEKIVNKKFDIRFWVLVKSFMPLDAYIFEQGYLRLSSEKYKFSANQSLQKHLKTHLTNFSINFLPDLKQSSSMQRSDENQQDESYLLFSDFINYLEGNQNSQSQKIQKSPLFKKIYNNIQQILTVASTNWRPCQSDKNSFELFGFDIILDCQLQPYILECNMSPACHQRGQLKHLVQQMGSGLLQLIGLINLKNQSSCETNKLVQKSQNSKRNWIKFKPEEQSLSFLGSNSQGLIKGNFQDLYIFGESKQANQILEQDFKIDFIQKVLFLQRFFKNRYNYVKGFKNRRNISKACILIQTLSKITIKKKKLWVKKLVKYTKKYIKKKSNQFRIDSKI